MFNWFGKKSSGKQVRTMIGDLDLLTKKDFFVRYKGKEWRIPELTAGEYASFCALLAELEKKTAAKEPEAVEELYVEIFGITVPDLPGRIVRKMPLGDSHALFLTVLRHYGLASDGSDKKKVAAKSQTTS